MNNKKEFENILDQCLESLLKNGGTVEQCLKRFPTEANELRPLLETFSDARLAAEIRPSADFRNKARNEFQAELREMEGRKSRSFFSFEWLRQPQWATVAIAAVILLATGGTAAAAGGSMPDQFLYPVKRATEHAQMAFTFTQLDKAQLNTRLADKRVAEIVYLAGDGKYDEIAAVTEALSTNLDRVAKYSSGRAAAKLAMITPTRPKQAEILVEEAESIVEDVAVESTMGEEERLEIEAAESEPDVTSTEKRGVPETVLPSEEPLPGIGGGMTDDIGANDPWYLLQQELARQYGVNFEQLYELVEKVPESARPALISAITVSENGYNKALESFINLP
ncbi:DUF5667 domain-containing protein [Chloroflexota bacterium]